MSNNKIIGTKIQMPLMALPKKPTINFGGTLSAKLRSIPMLNYYGLIKDYKLNRIYY